VPTSVTSPDIIEHEVTDTEDMVIDVDKELESDEQELGELSHV
jgi:hypothetical protein